MTSTEYTVIPTRNYTGVDEASVWREFKWWHSLWRTFSSHDPPHYRNKQKFRTRRSYLWAGGQKQHPKISLRISVGNSNEIGAFVRLTNNYILVGGDEEILKFASTVKGDTDIPLISTTLAGCRVIGRMCVGNKHGLLVPDSTYDTEMRNIEAELPDSVKVRKVEGKLSALGNVITCNDKIALIHPDLDKESEEIIADALQVEVFRHTIGSNPLVGSYCVLNSMGGLVGAEVSDDFLENLASLLQLPLLAGTVNNGCRVVASGLVVNDAMGYAGMKTTSNEFKTIETAFQFDSGYVW